MALLIDYLVEKRLLEVEAQRDGAHDIHMQIVAGLVEAEHRFLEPRCVTLLRPLVFPSRVPIAPDFHALLVVRCLSTKLSNFTGVGRLCDTLATDGDVTAVGARILPC